MAEITIDEKTILKIIGDYYGVPSMYVCMCTDYKFIKQGDDKVRKNYIYGIVHIDDSKIVQPITEKEQIFTKANYIMSLHKEYGCDFAEAEKAHEKALEYLRDRAMLKG